MDNESGWQEHPGTRCGHYYRAGAVKSLCSRETRNTGAVKADCTIKCSVCQSRLDEAFTPSLFESN